MGRRQDTSERKEKSRREARTRSPVRAEIPSIAIERPRIVENDDEEDEGQGGKRESRTEKGKNAWERRRMSMTTMTQTVGVGRRNSDQSPAHPKVVLKTEGKTHPNKR